MESQKLRREKQTHYYQYVGGFGIVLDSAPFLHLPSSQNNSGVICTLDESSLMSITDSPLQSIPGSSDQVL